MNFEDFIDVIKPIKQCEQIEAGNETMIQFCLINIFEKILESNRLFEKEIKTKYPKIKLFDAFEMLADKVFQNNLITLTSFSNFMKGHKSKKVIKYIIQRYDQDKDDALSIQEFTSLLNPFFNSVLNLSNDQTSDNNHPEKDDIKITLSNLNHNIDKIIKKMGNKNKSELNFDNLEIMPSNEEYFNQKDNLK